MKSKHILSIGAAIVVICVLMFVVRFRSEPKPEPLADPQPAPAKVPETSSPLTPMVESPLPPAPPEPEPEPVSKAGRVGRPPNSFGQTPLPLNLESPAFARQEDGRILKKDVAKMAEDLNITDRDPIEDIQILHSLVTSYHQIFRENPIAGENREVVEALTGKNPYQLMLIDPGHPAISADGELLDRWKVPYRFHPISRDYMEILSAGADREFGTGDDVMVEEPVEFGNRTAPEDGDL